jgi:LPXTG-motif cell wall-anchored protein
MIKENVNEYIDVGIAPIIPALAGTLATLTGVRLYLKERARKQRKQRERARKLAELYELLKQGKISPEQYQTLASKKLESEETPMTQMNILPILGIAGAGIILYLLLRRKKEERR